MIGEERASVAISCRSSHKMTGLKSGIWYSEFGKFKSYFGISPQPTGVNYFVIGRSVVNEKRPADGSAI